MAKIKEILIEIQDRLVSGQSPSKIAEELQVPLSWITETEMDMEWTWDPTGLIDDGAA